MICFPHLPRYYFINVNARGDNVTITIQLSDFEVIPRVPVMQFMPSQLYFQRVVHTFTDKCPSAVRSHSDECEHGVEKGGLDLCRYSRSFNSD